MAYWLSVTMVTCVRGRSFTFCRAVFTASSSAIWLVPGPRGMLHSRQQVIRGARGDPAERAHAARHHHQRVRRRRAAGERRVKVVRTVIVDPLGARDTGEQHLRPEL